MNSIKLEKIFKILTLVSFAMFFIGMLMVALLDPAFNKINFQYFKICFTFIFGFIFVVGIIWDVLYIKNRSKTIINNYKKEITRMNKSFDAVSNNIKNATKKEKILSAIFLVWFISSILLMLYFAGNNRIELILSAQYVIIFVTAIILSQRKK